jgi:ribosomal 50S subunit-associated protein YjgA (DUF615 family)
MKQFNLNNYLNDNPLLKESTSEYKNSTMEESIVDKIKSLFQRTPNDVKLMKSLDLFNDGLLDIGEEKYNTVIEKAKKLGMNISREEAVQIIQKMLANEIQSLES